MSEALSFALTYRDSLAPFDGIEQLRLRRYRGWPLEFNRTWFYLPLFTSFNQRSHNGWIVTSAHKALNPLQGNVELHGLLIGPISSHCIESIGHSDDSAHDGNLVSLQSLRIAFAIYHFVMHVHSGQELLHCRNLRHDLVALLRMLLHDLVFFVRKCRRLLQNAVI